MVSSAPATGNERSSDLPALTLALAAGSFAATLLLFPAIAVFLGNVQEFPFSLRDALPCLLALAALLAMPAFLLLRLAHGTCQARLVATVLGLAVAAWGQANLLSWDYGLLDGTSIPWNHHLWRGLADLTLWLAITGLFILRWRVVRRHARHVALVLLLVQLAGSVVAAAGADIQPSYLGVGFDPAKRFRLSGGRNVIVIILDGAQSSEFQRVLEEEPALRRAFDGFTYFRDAVADFSITQASIPAMLTGQRYDNSLPYARFVDQAYLTRSSLPLALRRQGFLVDIYALRRTIRTDERLVSNLRRRAGLAGSLAVLLDVTAFRVAPQGLKRVVYADQRWLVRRAAQALGLDERTGTALSPEIADNFEFCESFRREAATVGLETAPVFKLFHLLGPHLPLSVNERGERESLPYSPQNYRRTLAGITRLVASLLDTLRHRDLYDRSLLLIVSDHGHYAPVVLPSDRPLPAGDAPADFPRALALVLVKPVSARGPLRVSDAPVQLSDVPKTVLSQLRLGASGVEGADMFALAAESPRLRTFRAMRDAHWQLSRRLSVMTEYSVSGFSWLRSSWSPTGRVFGSYGEALQVFRRLRGHSFLGEPTAETNRGTLPGMVVTNGGELVVFFTAPDPKQGDSASVRLPLDRLEPGRRYRLALDVLDNCPDVYPGRFQQSLWLDQERLDTHDLAADNGVAWRRIRHEFAARSRRSVLRAELRVVGPVEAGQSWGGRAQLGLRRVRLRPLDR